MKKRSGSFLPIQTSEQEGSFQELEIETGLPLLHIPEYQPAVTSLQQLMGPPQLNNKYHVVYVWGPTGIGKSSLIQSFLCNEIPQSKRSAIYCSTAAQFAADFAEASQERAISEFQQSFEQITWLVIEDLQGIQRKTETQSQLVSLVDQVRDLGGRVIFSACVTPGELQETSRRLINRCHGGVMIQVPQLSLASRVTLLSHFAEHLNVPLTTEAAELLGQSIQESPRELLACIKQLAWRTQDENFSQHRVVDLEFANSFIRSIEQKPSLTPSKIAKEVARHFDLSVTQLRSDSRSKHCVLARQCCMLLMREMTNATLREIARYFRKKNHSTVIHACRRLDELKMSHPTLSQELEQIRRSLRVLS